jgi:hypothetical protein
MFWGRDSSVVPAKIGTTDLTVYILVIVLTVLTRIDLKIIQTSVLMK